MKSNVVACVCDERGDSKAVATPPPLPVQRVARVVLLGCGTVGSAVARRLLESGASLGVELSRVLVRDVEKLRDVPRELLTDSIDEALADEPDVVIELLGGIDPALVYVKAALLRGVPVVTANKTLVARYGVELDEAAARGKTRLVYEAAACAAIPVFAALRHLEGDRVRRITGIVNGSCNYILSKMSRGATYEAALAQAAAKGLVEPDPSADVSGRDSAEKLSLLVRAADPYALRDRVETNGISGITPEDILAARRAGCVIKLIAEFSRAEGVLRVGPTWVPKGHVLAGVEDEENAIVIESELAGEIVLRGKGAGPRPTSSAVLGDVVRVLSDPHPKSSRTRAGSARNQACGTSVASESDARGQKREGEKRHYVRIDHEVGTPAAVLGLTAVPALAIREIAVSKTSTTMIVDAGSAHEVERAIEPTGVKAVVCGVWRVPVMARCVAG